MKILIIDNYDSFTYNLAHILEQLASHVMVKRNNEINLNDIKAFHKIVFSPGPGLPSEVKIMHQIIDEYKNSKPILGVCLGHQSIAEFFGATLINMPEVNHGREFATEIINQDYFFNDIPPIFPSARYHSWIVNRENFPESLEITSQDEITKNIMSIKHKNYDIRGVQFHPESIMTQHGMKMLTNWIKH